VFDAVLACLMVVGLARPCHWVRIHHIGIATTTCVLFVPQSLCGLAGRVTWTFILKAVKEACVHGFNAAMYSERFVKTCLYATFGAVWVAASIMGVVAWELMGRDEVATYQVVASLELPAVMFVLHLGWCAFPVARTRRVGIDCLRAVPSREGLRRDSGVG
jgi:hypothetical protein